MGREKAARGSVSTPPGAGAAQTTSDRGAASSRPEGADVIPIRRPAGSAARHASLPKNRRVTAKASSPARDDSDRDPPSARTSRAAPRKRPGGVVLMFFGLAAVATVIVVLSQRGPNRAKEETSAETATKPEAPKPREILAPPPIERSPATMVTVAAAPPTATDPPAPTPSATTQPAATVAPKPKATVGTSPAEKPITTAKPAAEKAPPPKPAGTKPPASKPEDIY